MAEAGSRNLIVQLFWLTRKRPGQIFSAGRCYILFYIAHLQRMLFKPAGLELEENVRLQRNSSINIENPYAKIKIGKNSVLYEDAKLEAYGHGEINIGRDSVIGNARIVSKYKITIGSGFLSSWNVFLQDYDSHPISANERRLQVKSMVDRFRPSFSSEEREPTVPFTWNFPGEEIVIGDNVWVGANCTILKGAKIGNGCIVAAGSVVIRGEYPERSLLAGNPARVVKELPE